MTDLTSILAVSPDFTIITVVSIAVIGAAAVWSAMTLRKPKTDG